jgi:hypothetical protein
MEELFQKRFQRLQDLLQTYQNEVNGLSHDQLNQTPGSGGWSINQVIHHISGAEAGTILYIQKKLINPSESKNAGIKSLYRSTLLRYALRSKRKFRAPKVLTEPTGPYHVEELFTAWKATRNELEKLFDSIPAEHKKRQLFRHPVVGYISLKQTLGFMGHHMQRHLEQIQRIKSTL